MPLNFMPFLGTGISALESIYGMSIAGKQNALAEKLAKHQRPTYQVPQGMQESLGLANRAFLDQDLPGQALMEDKLQAGTANALAGMRESGNPADLMAGAVAANANENNSMNDLFIKGAEMQRQDQLNLAATQERMAGYQDKAWEYNERDPYEMDMKAASALREAGGENMFNAFKNLTSIGASLVTGGMGEIFSKSPDAGKMDKLTSDLLGGGSAGGGGGYGGIDTFKLGENKFNKPYKLGK